MCSRVWECVFLEKIKSMGTRECFPLLAFFASADGRSVGNGIRLQALQHVIEQLQCPLPLLAFLAGADGRAVADELWPQMILPQSF